MEANFEKGKKVSTLCSLSLSFQREIVIERRERKKASSAALERVFWRETELLSPTIKRVWPMEKRVGGSDDEGEILKRVVVQ